MAKVRVNGEGPMDATILVIGERPGAEEVKLGRPFVGTSGIELFGGWRRVELPKGSGSWRDVYGKGRWERIVKVPREQIRIENLVRTYSQEPPADWEIRRDEKGIGLLKMPNLKLIVPIGAHSTKWLFGHPVTMDLVGGVAHAQGRVTVVPIIHPAAALRSPEQNQERLSADLRGVRAYLDGQTPKTFTTAAPIRVLEGAVPADPTLIGIDCEGTPAHPECITLSWNGQDTYCCYADDPAELRTAQMFIDAATTIVAHYAVYDLKVAAAMGLTIPDHKVHCSMLQAFALAEKQGVKDLAYRHLGLDLPTYKELVGPVDDAQCRQRLHKLRMQALDNPAMSEMITTPRVSAKTGKVLKPKTVPTPEAKELQQGVRSIDAALQNPESGVRKRWAGSTVLSTMTPPPDATWKDLPDPIREPYACTDPWLARTMYQQFVPRLSQTGTDRVYATTRRILPMIARMETAGMQVDIPGLVKFQRALELRYYRQVHHLSMLVGKDVNPRGPDQVSDLLFHDLLVEATKRTKSGKHYTTDDKYLKARAGSSRTSDHAKQVIATIIAARKTWKMRSYCTNAITKADNQGVIHPNIKYTRVTTGRFAEWLLTLPKHGADARRFRSLFVARPGHALVSSDLSQIELRVAAHLSGDTQLCQEYRDGKDKHQETVDKVLKQPGNADETVRRIAKNLNFAVLMGTTEFGFRDQLGEQGIYWDLEQCRAVLDGWYNVYHGVRAFNQRQHAHALDHGYVVAPLSGRRRYVGGVHSTVPYIREAALREVQAFAYSADAQFIMQTWMGAIWEQVLVPCRRYAEPWLQVHDDVVIECDAPIVVDITAQMEVVLPQQLDIPTVTKSASGPAWGVL
jgi:DNA polymerase I-like protein with 3'-5' exonuclease and polymerase domains/uracil-DNA glycosylase